MQADPADTIPAVLPEVHLLRQQAERATAVADHASAVTAYTAALALLPNPLGSDVRDLVYNLLCARAACYKLLGDYPSAEADLTALLNSARELSDPMREMEVIAEQVQVAIPQGKVAVMQPVVERMLERAQTAGELLLEAAALATRAEIEFRTSDFARAHSDAEAALVTFEQYGNSAVIARLHWLLGAIDSYTGELAAGHAHAETALALYHALGDRCGAANTLNIMGYTSSDYAHQRDVYRQALAIYTELGDRRGQGIEAISVGIIYLKLGLYGRAATYLESSSFLRDIQAHASFAYTLQNLGNLALERGDADQALAFLKQGYAYADAAGDEILTITCTSLLGRVALLHGDLERATELLHTAANRSATLDAPADRAAALAWLGATYLQHGDVAAARSATAEATALLEAGAESADYALQEVWWWRWKALTAASQPYPLPIREDREQILV